MMAMDSSFNSEKYRLETKNTLVDETSCIDTKRYHVNEKNEKIVLTKKYRILNAHDPNTGINYDLDKLLDLNIIDIDTGLFCLPNATSLIELDEAIKLGYVNADLIDQKIETSNESFEYIEVNNVKISENFNYNKNIKFGVKV